MTRSAECEFGWAVGPCRSVDGKRLLVLNDPRSAVSLTLLARDGLESYSKACGFIYREAIGQADREPEELRLLPHRRQP